MRFGQYEIFGRIAIGGMAEIYEGRAIGEEGFEKPVAIKRILPHHAQDARFVTMLLTEARIHVQLSHKNIVQIHDLGVSEEGEYFIVLEYIDGRDLGALLEVMSRAATSGSRGMRLLDGVALYVIMELGEGVHFAHEQRGPDGQPLGLIHRDISPSNVLLSYAGEVKLSDFGLAKRRTDVSVVGSLKGKLAYMSPEQARRVPLDRRSDIFALGAVLFEMLTGRRLREITSEVEGWRQVASGQVPSARAVRADLPAVLDRVLAGALAPDPRDRFPDARTLVEAARAALEHVPRTAASETVELQHMLKRLLPPGSPRPVTAPSKVIRLVSEFAPPERMVRASKRATAPQAPAQHPTPARTRARRAAPAPGLTPPMPRTSIALPAPTPRRRTPLSSPTGPTGRMARLPEPLAGGHRESAPHHQVPRHGRSSARLARRFAFALLVAVPVAATVIHYGLVPLPVLKVWLYPARLEVLSRPPGAAVYLDNHRHSALTPTYIEVHRDRRTHEVEMRKEGFVSARRLVRFDQSETPSVDISLVPSSRPSFQPILSPAPPRP